MNIVVTTLIWKRPEIFKIWATSICRIINTFPKVHIDVLVAGSEEEVSKKMVEFYGFDYLETPNNPLSNKANIRLQACKKYNSDYVLFLGSDDIMNNKTFSFILDKMKKGHDEIAPMDLYIYDTVSKQFIYSYGYLNNRKGERLAIGRAIKSELLKSINWNMWSSGKNRSLDGNSKRILDTKIKNPFYYYLKENGLMIIDIKSQENLSPFKIRDNHKKLPIQELEQIEEYKLIQST